MTSMTLTAPFQGSMSKDSLRSVFQVLGASLFLAFCAQIALPLGFTPVPLSMQTLGVMLVGAFLGKRKGALAVLAYLAEGSLGFPVFAGGAGGILRFVGPTAGYLLGFVVQAYLVGWWVERRESHKVGKTLSILALSFLVQLGCGTLWLSSFVGLGSALSLGMYPFIMGETLKAIGVACYLKKKCF